MVGRLGIAAGVLAVLALCFVRPPAYAQTSIRPARATIDQPINDNTLTVLSGNTRREARNRANDRGIVPNDTPMPHLKLQLRRPAELEQGLNTLIDQLHDPASPNYHHWLPAADFGAQFGPAASDIATVTSWLQQHGFTVNTVYPNGMVIDFSATAGQVRATFHTEIHNLVVNGVDHFANTSDPQIPAALAPAVVGIVALHDFSPRPMVVPKRQYTFPDCDGSSDDISCYLVAPPDLATIYNFNPLFSQGITGTGQTIYVIEDTNLFTNNDWNTFRSTFGLSGYTGASLTTIHPQQNGGSNCVNPGVNSDSGEAALDVEWASAAAPNAAIVVASCSDLITAALNVVNAANPPTIMSVSYGECEAQQGSATNATVNSMWQQGAAEGISIFVSAGDEDAAGCDDPDTENEASNGIAVNGLASTQYNVATGGTDFSDAYSVTTSTYWNSNNTSTGGSAKSYIPEIPWNDSCASQLLATVFGYSTTYGSNGFCNSSTGSSIYLSFVGGSGGPSQIYGKPSWQSGFAGIQNDNARDLPDVSLFAANGIWSHYYIFCWSDVKYSSDGAATCTGAPSTWSGAGGTSFTAPILAGVQALINEYTGSRQGNPNPVYYKLAAIEYGASGSTSCNSSGGNTVASSCIFYDVTLGDNDAVCTSGSPNCYDPSGVYGVLSTSTGSFAPAYATQTGWDFATGIGTINVYNLVTNWASGGGGNAELTVSVSGSGTVTSAPVGINCGSTCSTNFTGGAQITLTATPTNGWAFTGWGGACSGTGSCVVTMNAAESVAATFTQIFTLSVNDSGSGTVTSSPSGISCGSTCSASFISGTQVTLNETPASGWAFAGWGGACSGTGSCVVAMSAAENVSVTFTQNSYTLSISVSGSGSLTSSPSGISCPSACSASYASGTGVTLTATPATGWIVSGWGGSCTSNGTSPTCNVTMNAAENVSVTFTANGGGGQSGTKLYVNPETGADTGSCAQTAPCQTLNFTLAQATAGSVIEIETGGTFGPIYLDQPVVINGPADGSAAIVWSNTLPGCIGGDVGSCDGSIASYAVEIAAGATNGGIEINNLVIDNGAGTNGALHVASAYSVSMTGTVLRGGTGAIPQIMLVDSTQNSPMELFFSNCDVGFSSSGGGVLVAPTSATPVTALFQGGEVHNGLFGVKFDATGLNAGAKISAEVDRTRFFSFTNSAVTAKAGSGGSAEVLLSRSTIENAGSSAFNVNGGNALGLLFKSTITGNQVGVAAASGGTVYSFGNNEIFGNSTNVTGSLTKDALQ